MMNGEEELIQAAVKGDSSAFGSLYDHYQAMIYRFVAIKVGSREEAEDITHQVFLSAWQKVKTYKHRGHPFSSWLYRIARNQVIDHYRSGRSVVSLEKIDPELFATPEREPEHLARKFQLEEVRKAIASLKPDYQDVIIMRFVEDVSLKETAAALKKTEGAIKLIQHRAVKELKRMLGDEATNDHEPF